MSDRYGEDLAARALMGMAVRDPRAQVKLTLAPDPPTTAEDVIAQLEAIRERIQRLPFVVVHPDTANLNTLLKACAEHSFPVRFAEHVEVGKLYVVDPSKL